MLKLSIITAVYNNLTFLKQAIASVQQQNITDIEHIIVDNLSSDGTEMYVLQYQKTALYPVVYIREADTGIYNALNKGIKAARGEWIHFLHADDQYVPEALSRLVFPKMLPEIELLAFAVEYVAQESQRSRTVYAEYDKTFHFLMFPHTGSFFRKTVFEKYGLYDERYKVISDIIFIVKYYHVLKYETYRDVVLTMSGDGLSSKHGFVNQYERMILYWRYVRAPWAERFKILGSVLKRRILR